MRKSNKLSILISLMIGLCALASAMDDREWNQMEIDITNQISKLDKINEKNFRETTIRSLVCTKGEKNSKTNRFNYELFMYSNNLNYSFNNFTTMKNSPYTSSPNSLDYNDDFTSINAYKPFLSSGNGYKKTPDHRDVYDIYLNHEMFLNGKKLI